MIELVRIVENQAVLYSYRATQSEAHAEQLELMIEETKPINSYPEWYKLIATPFRYNPPHPEARFRPPFGKNVFYASLIEETALYEHAFYFMRERMHLNVDDPGIGERTIFFVDANDNKTMQIKNNDNNFLDIINRNNYAASHQFITAHPDITFILYPSYRDPQQRDNAAILDINHLEKYPKSEASIKYFYNNKEKQLTWIDYHLHITWAEVK